MTVDYDGGKETCASDIVKAVSDSGYGASLKMKKGKEGAAGRLFERYRGRNRRISF